MVDLEELLEPISEERPCGPDLEYADAFLELEKLAEGTPARQDLSTGGERPAEPPPWPTVRDKAIALLSQTKDLRVAVRLIEAATRTNGPKGLRTGMQLLHRLVTEHWDTVHPQLDSDELNDPSLRINILAALCDPANLLKGIREMPIVSVPEHGRFSLRDIDIASGRVQPVEAEDTATAGAIEAAFLNCDLEELKANAMAFHETVVALNELIAALDDCTESSAGLDFSPLRQVLQSGDTLLSEWVVRRQGDVVVDGEVMPEAGGQPLTDIRNRDDIVRALDRICDYLYRTEPANPVPLLLERAKRLMSKNFVEIIQDLAPEIMPQIDKLRGVESSE